MEDLTNEELDQILELTNEFWHAFSSLVNGYLLRVPEKLKGDLLLRLGEKTSVYGRETPSTVFFSVKPYE